jgi:hypothetical protein
MKNKGFGKSSVKDVKFVSERGFFCFFAIDVKMILKYILY